MHNGSTSSSVPTSAPPPPPPLPLGGLNNWNSNSNTAPQNSGNANPTAIPQVTHPVQPPSCDFRDELKKKFAKQNQAAADDRKQPEGQTAPTLSPKPIVQKQQNQRVIAALPTLQKQQDTQSKLQQQPTTEINNSDQDKIVTTQPKLENSPMPISVLKVNISVPKLSIAICLLFTSNVSAIGCIAATAILYKAAVVPIVPIAIFAISMLVMFPSIIYIVSSIKNALKVDIESNVPLAPEENPGNVVDPSKLTPPPIISSESSGASQPPTPSPLISNHSSNDAPPPPPPPPIANHSSSGAPHLPSNGPSKPGNNMGNGDARCALFSQIQEGVKLKTRKERDELLNQINQTKSDEKKPNSGAMENSLLGHKFLNDRRKAICSSDSEDEHSSYDHENDRSDDESDDTSARSQSSTNNKLTKPPVSEKPPGLMKMPNKAAAPVNASIDNTKISFVKGRSKFFENRG